MHGKITSFVLEKSFGFIHGDDGKDYFFHIKDFPGSHPNALTDGLPVNFEPTATPKGYRAQHCKIIEKDLLGYEAPDSLLTTKFEAIKGWELVKVCDWIVESEWNSDKETSLKECKRRAELLGANALLEFQYTKRTDSTSTEGNGTYYFSTFQYVGRPAYLARRSTTGQLHKSDFPSLNENAESILRSHEREVENCKKRIKEFSKKAGIASITSIAFTIVVHQIEIFWLVVAFHVALLIYGINVRSANTPSFVWISKKSPKSLDSSGNFKLT